MNKELSEKLTKVYEEENEKLQEAIDNLDNGCVVFVRSDSVEAYDNLDAFKRENKGLVNKDVYLCLLEGKTLDYDGLYIEVVR